MIAFQEEHSSSWLELMEYYQQYRAAVFRWVNEAEDVRRKDLLMELTPLFSKERSLSRRFW